MFKPHDNSPIQDLLACAGCGVEWCFQSVLSWHNKIVVDFEEELLVRRCDFTYLDHRTLYLANIAAMSP
ncbi:hypothetical protein CUMW_006050 [Citrus unshiu]|nr:hypothetical protein CUMW_006050 [Citrus unshiu]